jgi:DUF438 domain-containing protein
MKVIKLKESQIKEIVSKIIKENENENYMFFSNLEQIKRQCDLLLNLDKNMVNEILTNGHDWADDHVSSAKENIDQVFDFLMNETKKEGNVNDLNEMEEIDESKNCPTDPAKWAASKAKAKRKFDVYPSAYANGFAAKDYKAKGGGWKKCN